MKNLFLILTMATLVLSSCKKDDDSSSTPTPTPGPTATTLEETRVKILGDWDLETEEWIGGTMQSYVSSTSGVVYENTVSGQPGIQCISKTYDGYFSGTTYTFRWFIEDNYCGGVVSDPNSNARFYIKRTGTLPHHNSGAEGYIEYISADGNEMLLTHDPSTFNYTGKKFRLTK